MTDFYEVLGKLDKKTRDRVLAASDIHIEYIKTPAISLNSALNGGLPLGRQVMIYGNKSSGKSSLCLEICAEAQRNGKVVAWMDAEKTFDPEWAARLGVDTEHMIVEQVSDAVRLTTDVSQMMQAGVDVIVVDSISSIVPMSYFEKDSLELKGLEAARQIGTSAKDLGEMVKIWNQMNNNTLLILISQVRNKLGSMYVTTQPTGGFAAKFYSSTIVRLWSSESEKQARLGEVRRGEYATTEPIGREVSWTIENSKTSRPFQTGTYDFYFEGDFVGVDRVAEVADEAVKYGLIEKGGAWYTIGETRLQGRDKLINHLRSLPDEFDALVKELEAL
jgi:recombination protein RecA